MEHADLFKKISTKKDIAEPKASSLDNKAIETIKVLAKQVIDIKEILEKQNEIIKKLQEEVVGLRHRQKENADDVKLMFIQHEDLHKQFKTLKATTTTDSVVDNRVISVDEIAKRFYKNYENSELFAEPPKTEAPKKIVRVQDDDDTEVNLKPSFRRLPRLLDLE